MKKVSCFTCGAIHVSVRRCFVFQCQSSCFIQCEVFVFSCFHIFNVKKILCGSQSGRQSDKRNTFQCEECFIFQYEPFLCGRMSCYTLPGQQSDNNQTDRQTDVHVEREEPLCDDPRSGQCAVEGGVLGEGCRFSHDGRVPEDGDEERDKDLTEEEDGRLEVW